MTGFQLSHYGLALGCFVPEDAWRLFPGACGNQSSKVWSVSTSGYEACAHYSSYFLFLRRLPWAFPPFHAAWPGSKLSFTAICGVDTCIRLKFMLHSKMGLFA